MATKVDQASAVQPRGVQTTVVTTSATSISSSKVSMFGAKSGFVIPKNKLSGSLVPVFRGGGKLEVNVASKEESAKQVLRKTKWGTDLTQDAAVREGRALAYQTQVEQITQQLQLGVPRTGDMQTSQSATLVSNSESSGDQMYNENLQSQKLELLELERREAIGEILKLNPSYKAPPDYMPLLNEAVVPIPLKEYPEYNFIGLLLGPGRNTQKRLEEETGSKIQVLGTKAGTREKAEITRADGNEIFGVYEELYVHVSADTYEKVDAAIALIELLVTPVSGNSAVVSTTPTSVSGDSVNVLDQSQDLVTGFMMPIAEENQGVMQPMIGPAQSGPPHFQFQPYPSPWFPLGHPHTSNHPLPGFTPHPNSSLPIPNDLLQFSPSSLNPSNVPSYFVGRPPAVAGFGSVSRNPYLVATRPQPTMPVLQRQFMPEAWPPSHVSPRNYSMPGPQPPSAYPTASAQPNSTVPLPFTGNQPIPAGPASGARQPVPSMPQSRSVTTIPSGPLPNRLSNSVGGSTGWSGVPAITSAPHGTGNMMQMAPPNVPPQKPHSIAQPVAHVQLVNVRAPQNPILGSSSVSPPMPLTSPQPQSGIPIISGSLPSFSPVKPPVIGLASNLVVTAPKPQNPSSGNFTFQPPLRPQLPASHTVPRFSGQPLNTPTPPKPVVQPSLAPRSPFFQPSMHSASQPGIQRYPGSQVTNQIGQPHVPVLPPSPSSVVPFAGNPIALPPPPRVSAMPNPHHVLPTAPTPQMGPQNFGLAFHMPNMPGSLPPHPANPSQLQQNQLSQTTRAGNLLVPNQHFNNNTPFASGKPASSFGGNQIYDPFLPTSTPK